MYDRKFVKKRKRRAFAILGGAVSSCGIGALIIVSFLGRYVGTFTVTLDTSNVKLSLSQKADFSEPTTVLTIDYLPPYQEWTYRNIVIDEEAIDSEDTDYLYGGIFDSEEDEIARTNPSAIEFFKYTFYIKNVGVITAKYRMSVNILENSPDSKTGSKYLDETLRVAIYENDPYSEAMSHDSKVYAKQSATSKYDEDGEVTFKEYVSTDPSRATPSNPYYGLAELFESDNVITTYTVSDFMQNDIKRYTLVAWLEGEDPGSNKFKEPPVGAKIKLGVEINAYEND